MLIASRTGLESLPLIHIYMSLMKDAVERADGDLAVFGHDGDIDRCPRRAHEFDVTSLLAGLDETGLFKTALDFTEG